MAFLFRQIDTRSRSRVHAIAPTGDLTDETRALCGAFPPRGKGWRENSFTRQDVTCAGCNRHLSKMSG